MHQPKSADEFNVFLNENLGKIICLYFYADWAEPCVLIDQLLAAQEELNDSILYVKVLLIM
jgi:thiol:disulfide interchange protein